MTLRIGTWLRKKKKSKDSSQPSSLPATRTRSLSATLPVAHATAESAFIQRLPKEVRRCILIEAFGGQSLHFDLQFEYLVKKSRKGVIYRHRHANIPQLEDRDTTKTRQVAMAKQCLP